MNDKRPLFTPGPWFKKGKKVFWQKPDRELPKDNLWNGTICICATTEDDVPEANEEARANAALIAAAPEMYALLDDIRKNYQCMPNPADVERRINALLARARGEAE